MSRAEIREREKRWALPVALASFFAVALMIGSLIVNQVSGTGAAEILRSTDAHNGSVLITGLMQALALALLAIPLAYLFRAARARTPRVRGQLIGLVVVAPLFLALSAGLSVGARQEAADQFVAGEAKSTLTPAEAKKECRSDRKDEGAADFADEYEPHKGETAQQACEDRKIEDDEAANAQSDASLTPLSTALGIAGGLGLAVSLLYTCLWAMRVGLLTRFWGSLGMALGVAVLISFIVFTVAWFLYFGLLVLGWLPGGRPPAWEEGEAVPWPTPGERAAAELEPPAGEEPEGSDTGPEKRKRKQRD